MEIYDGEYDQNATLIATLCGDRLKQTKYTSETGALYVRFRSDEEFEYAGFTATVTSGDPGK